MFCSIKYFEENASEILKRVSHEEYEKFIHSIHRSADINMFSAITELTSAELALVHCAAAYPESNDGNLITVAQAASELGISAPAVSRTLKNLEVKGFITRNTDPKDRRSVRISVTESGLKTMKGCLKQSVGIINETLAGFSDEELKTIMRLHCKFTENMAKVISERKTEKQKGATD